MSQASPGNIFTADEREKRLYVTVTDPRGVAQRLTWQGRDFEGQLLFQGEATSFSNEVAIDLAKAPVGYATLALALAGKDGQRLFEHEAAFAILPADDRRPPSRPRPMRLVVNVPVGCGCRGICCRIRAPANLPQT